MTELFQIVKLVPWIVVVLLASLVAGCGYAIWRGHEEAKAADRARVREQELQRALALTHDLGKRGPSGWQKKEIA